MHCIALLENDHYIGQPNGEEVLWKMNISMKTLKILIIFFTLKMPKREIWKYSPCRKTLWMMSDVVRSWYLALFPSTWSLFFDVLTFGSTISCVFGLGKTLLQHWLRGSAPLHLFHVAQQWEWTCNKLYGQCERNNIGC